MNSAKCRPTTAYLSFAAFYGSSALPEPSAAFPSPRPKEEAFPLTSVPPPHIASSSPFSAYIRTVPLHISFLTCRRTASSNAHFQLTSFDISFPLACVQRPCTAHFRLAAAHCLYAAHFSLQRSASTARPRNPIDACQNAQETHRHASPAGNPTSPLSAAHPCILCERDNQKHIFSKYSPSTH